MTHKYHLEGLTCSSCVADVKSSLLTMPDVVAAEVTRDSAAITMSRHISTEELQNAMGRNGKYKITEDASVHHQMTASPEKTWLQTYKPLLLVATFITGVSLLVSRTGTGIDGMKWMNAFMAGFFIVFSFFKLLDLRGFADSYAMYDLLAKRVKGYGYVYPFIEVALGVMYLTGFNPAVTTMATIIVMGFSSIGVIKSVLDKKQIRCACLGAVFNLPMSTVTIIEDLLMVGMALFMHFSMHHS